jgi:hypothetical protein
LGLEKLAEGGAGLAIGQRLTSWKVVSMTKIVLAWPIRELFGGSDLADVFDVLCLLPAKIGDGVTNACATDGFVSFLLHLGEPDGTLIEGFDDPGVFVRVGEERGGGLWIHEERRELGRGDLEADFRKLLGIVLAEVIGEMILQVSEAKLVFLLGAPFLVTAAGAPVGDVAFGDGDATLAKRPDNFGMGDVVVQEFVDHVSFEFRQAGDFAVAGALAEARDRGGRSGNDALV